MTELLSLAFKALSMKRWNNRPVLEVATEASNVLFSLIARLILEGRLRAELLNSMEFILLRVLPKCVLSDISYDTKELILKEDPEKWKEVYESAVREVLNISPKPFRNKLSILLDDEGEMNELNAIASLAAAEVEARTNFLFFPDYYIEVKETIERLKQRLLKPQIRGLYNTTVEVLMLLRPMVYAQRWNMHYRHLKTTVADHSFFVVFTAYLIAVWRNLDELNVLDVLVRSMFHDVPEAFTGDIISPTKRRVEGFERIVERVERRVVSEKLLPLLPEGLKDPVTEASLNPFDGLNGKIVRAADLIGSIVECTFELETGNMQRVFSIAKEHLVEELKSLGIEEATIVLNNLDSLLGR
ncbi:MAG TPA: hypothetical protein DHV12_05045 [Thermotogae bacterium]|nr:hypothetical protein [Thermotogota bacterium]